MKFTLESHERCECMAFFYALTFRKKECSRTVYNL
jgi:hypothetical protein